MKKGKLIVLEGACDGIGKTTQYEKLYQRLVDDGYDVIKHHFPSYDTPQGNAVQEYLDRKYGPMEQLSPYFINSIFAHDRAVTWYSYLKNEYEKGKIILLDRYTTSSIIYQGANIKNISKRQEFIDYVIDFEYNKLKIKKPDLVLFLTMPFEKAQELRNKRTNFQGIANDIHEADLKFQKEVYNNSQLVAKNQKFKVINCIKNNELRSIDDIHEELYQKCIKLIGKKTDN